MGLVLEESDQQLIFHPCGGVRPRCNVWSWVSAHNGDGGFPPRRERECWLRRANASRTPVRIGVATWEAGTTAGVVPDDCDRHAFGPRTRFAKLDADASGALSRPELDALGAELVPPSSPSACNLDCVMRGNIADGTRNACLALLQVEREQM